MSFAPDLETWKAVVGYEGFYEVGDLGRVRSIDRIIVQPSRHGMQTRRLRGKILRQAPDHGPEGYGRLRVGLSQDNICITRLVHQLVAEAFIGPRPAGHEVAHWDGDASHNAASNLRYAVPAENTADKYRHGTILVGTSVGTAKLRESDILRIRALRGSATVCAIAERFGISIAHVSRIQNGKRWGYLRSPERRA